MAALWTRINGVVELGVYRMHRSRGDPPGIGAYMTQGFVVGEDADVPRLAGIGCPYLLGAAALSVLLLVDAACLAGRGAAA